MWPFKKKEQEQQAAVVPEVAEFEEVYDHMQESDFVTINSDSRSVQVSREAFNEILSAMDANNKVLAIKRLIDETGLSIREAKYMIDNCFH